MGIHTKKAKIVNDTEITVLFTGEWRVLNEKITKSPTEYLLSGNRGDITDNDK